jgi:Domain of unknown function (DUF4157)
MGAAAVLELATAKKSDSVPGAGLSLRRKCACGGNVGLTGECDGCRTRTFALQSKLRINEPGDIYEQEADGVAERVVAIPANAGLQAASLRIQPCSAHATGREALAPASVDRVLSSAGSPLETDLRQTMERHFGFDFSRVRVHHDAAAEQSARDVNAHAYTVGHHVVFGEGRFAPDTRDGRRLVAHELTHVVQQTGHVSLQRDDKKPDEFVIDPKAMELVESKLHQLYQALPRAERIELKASGTVAIGLVTEKGKPNANPRLVYTTASNTASPAFRNAAESVGLFQWLGDAGVAEPLPGPARPLPPTGPPPPGKGGIEHAEQFMIGYAEDHGYVVHGMAVSRRLCNDCPLVVQGHKGGRIMISVIPDPDKTLPNPRDPNQRPPKQTSPKQGPAKPPPKDDPRAKPTKQKSAKQEGSKPRSKDEPGAKPRPKPAKPSPQDEPSPSRTGGGSKVVGAALSTSQRIVNTSIQRAQAEMMKIAHAHAQDKDLAAVIDTTNDLLDIKNFAENPARFAAQNIKNQLIQGVFKHFAESLNKSRAAFADKFPDVATLQADPLTTGVSLETYEKKYAEALAALRRPDARKTLLYAFVTLGISDNTPHDVIEARLRDADRMLMNMPGIGEYMKNYSRAQAAYTLALTAVRRDAQTLQEDLGKQSGLAEMIRGRGEALLKAQQTLDDIANDLFDVPFPGFAEAAWELHTLADGFGDLGGGLGDFAYVVEHRKPEYANAIARLKAETQKVADLYHSVR